ncbi:MAG: sulfate adenylyltransferase subunit 2 [Myxococcales bacterium]|nr:MAG: sulfate adenylyltransferase subunit 2 [Myxococcales bacterium]
MVNRESKPIHLLALEAEAIFVFREMYHEMSKPVLLFSGGKDSLVLLHLAQKAFRPAAMPFAIMHVDTGHNFPEIIALRDQIVRENKIDLIVASVQKSIDEGRVMDPTGLRASRNRLQTVTLLDALKDYGFDAAVGGGRRDEDRARAKERVFSHRDVDGQWNPKNQRLELWSLYNGRINPGEHFRVFPLSNWTELDVWEYIRAQNIRMPDLYFAKKRSVFERDGMLYAPSSFIKQLPHEKVFEEMVRFRTIGDMTCTGAVRSNATTIDSVVNEVASARVTERGATRADDRTSDAAMEDRKREGYF